MMKRAAHTFVLIGFLAGLISCGGGGGSKTVVGISLSAPSTTVNVGSTLQLTATVTGTTDTAVTWQVNGTPGGNAATIGTISSAGLYTATVLPSPASVTITAVAQADATKSASVAVTVQNAAPTVTVTVSPGGTTNDPLFIQTFAKQTFTATVTGATNTAVTWSIACQVGGSACGAIGTTGNYVAPNSVPTFATSQGVTNDLVQVTATAQANGISSGSTYVYIKPLNQNALSAPIQLGSSGSSVGATCISGGSGFCYGGTLGSLISRAGVSYVMSNNHVLGLSDAATAGQAVTQPGEIETNCSQAGTITVANFTYYFPLQPQPTTAVDVAIAQIISGEVDTTGKILELGAVSNGIPQPGQVVSGSGMAATIGETIAKSGRTTGLTCSSVEAINTSARVGYEVGCTTTPFTVDYVNQVTVGNTSNGNNFIAEGDSGSLAVDESTATPVALLFAGGEGTAIGNPVSAVLTALTSGGAPTFVGGSAHAVAGCGLPAPTADGVIAKGANAPAATASLSADVAQAATSSQDRNAAELMNVQGVSAVGTGASLDSPGEAAVLVFVPSGESTSSIPAQINGLRTRVIQSDTKLRGSLTSAQTAQLASVVTQPSGLASDQVAKASAAKEAHVAELMSHDSVQGVGVSASLDSPTEAAVIIYVLKGQPHDFVATTLDGVRTRIKYTTPFKAGVSRPVKAAACSIPKTPSNVAPKPTTKPATLPTPTAAAPVTSAATGAR
jgi:hypothetical protein